MFKILQKIYKQNRIIIIVFSGKLIIFWYNNHEKRRKKVRNIAIVEDSENDIEYLRGSIDKYTQESGEQFNIFVFKDGAAFLDGYKPVYDLVFMDIEMPVMDGMRAAQKLRGVDSSVSLIFITNLAQFAIKGYEVNAVDFIVKPYAYDVFRHKFERALTKIERKNEERLYLKTESGVCILYRKDVMYVEVIGHYLYYHTALGVICCRGSLKYIMDMPFFKVGFAQCNKCYLANLALIKKIDGYNVYIGEEVLKISRPKKVKFMQELASFYASDSSAGDMVPYV